MRRAAFMLATAIVATLAAPPPAVAKTLRDALTEAYRTNPQLAAARQNLKATDETVALARANGLPAANANGTYTEDVLQPSTASSFSFLPSRSANGNLQLSVPIYSGGAVKNALHAARTRVLSGRASLRGSESSLFSQVVAAYMNVILGEQTVALNRANAGQLQVNLRATQDRFKIGDVTRTDVAQSDARLQLALGSLESARANLIAAKEQYIALVGSPPDNLQPPPPLPGLPESPQQAEDVALQNNPDLIAAQEASRAARYDVHVAEASRKPTISAVSGLNYSTYLGSLSVPPGVTVNNSTLTGQVGAQITIPLFQGGRPAAQIRQSEDRLGQAEENEIEAERQVVSQVRAAFASWQAAKQNIASAERAVSADQLSLEGVRAENSVGNRTILDILNAEQELLNAEVQLETAKRDAYVAGFTLLAAMGRAEARDLGLDGGMLYDPVLHSTAEHAPINDYAHVPPPVIAGTRTSATPVQTAPIEPLPPE